MCHYAFAVIADDDGIGVTRCKLDAIDEAFLLARVEAIAGFEVDTNDLLFVGDDSGFDAGGSAGMGEDAGATNLLLAQQLFEQSGAVILADGPEQFCLDAEGGKIASDVSGATGHEAFSLEFDDRHRCFGRDARDAAPDELVQHHVAEN